MPVFYIPINGPEGDKLVSLLANLSENFDVKVFDALKVETEVEFLVPMLEKLQLAEDMPKPKDHPETVSIRAQIACLNCGKLFTPKRIDNKTCSKVCYQAYQRKRNSNGGKKTRIPLPNQAKVNENLNEEQARIEAVVAKAQITAPSADFERHPTGPLMARKL